MTLNIAHRGASRAAPENTLQAFDLAVEHGADMIETDLHVSRDGEVPLYHDNDVAGVPVAELTLAELRERVPGLPTLQETLDAFGSRVAFNLELKSQRRFPYPDLPEKVLAEVRARDLLGRTLFSCFYDPALQQLRELEPAARIGLLISPRSNFAIARRAKRLGAEAVHPEVGLVDRALVERLHGRGWKVHVWTVDAEEEQQRLLDWGVDGIFTNVPGQLAALLAKRRES